MRRHIYYLLYVAVIYSSMCKRDRRQGERNACKCGGFELLCGYFFHNELNR
jgi:hypothetical protein